MQPIVHGIAKQFKACLRVEQVNFRSRSQWHTLIAPIGTPEFALLDSSKTILRRWIGFTDTAGFVEVLQPLCGG